MQKKHIIIAIFISLIAIFSIMQLSPKGEIYLTHLQSGKFHVVEVKAKNLAYPFFGVSFHLNFNKDTYKFDHYILGSFFKDSDPLVQVAEKNNQIISGISLKRGSLINKKDGTLLKLFFTANQNNVKTTDFYFTSPVYSTYSNGRVNIDRVIFTPQKK